MAFQSVPETAAVIIEYLQNGENVINTVYARKPGGYTLTTLGQLANSVDNAVAADWLPIQTEDTAYVRTIVRGLENQEDLEVEDSGGAGPGEVIIRGLPNNVTLSIKKTSGLTGRTARGRLYWIGLAISQLSTDENVVVAADVTAIVAAVEAIRTSLAVLGWFPVLVSRFLDGVKRDEGTTLAWVDSVAVNANVDSQRGRLTT